LRKFALEMLNGRFKKEKSMQGSLVVHNWSGWGRARNTKKGGGKGEKRR